MAAVEPLAPREAADAIAIEYRREPASALLAQPDVLAVVGYGDAPTTADPRRLSVPLQSLAGPAPLEVWRVPGPVSRGWQDDLAWAHGGGYLLVAQRVAEAEHGGLHGAAEHVYRRLCATIAELDHPHLLRAWNYLADINAGVGDEERYRHFSVGRARGIAGLPADRFPAATAIGRHDGVEELVVYALAAKAAGQPIENPRQVSAYRYPRQYGPVPPSFARAMRLRASPPTLLISGTASVVGHASLHDEPNAQIVETLRNIESLAGAAGMAVPGLVAGSAWLKVYVRHAEHAADIRAELAAYGIASERLICLHGDICRRELLVEIDGCLRGS